MPWAVISGYGEDGEWGGAAAITRVQVHDFELDVTALALGINNRIEVSYARQKLKVEPLGLVI